MEHAFRSIEIGFCESNKPLVRAICEPGFSHCVLFGQCTDSWWLMINPSFTGCQFIWLDTDEKDAWFTKNNATIMRLNQPVQPGDIKPSILGWRTCTSIISYILGLKKLHAWPFGLFLTLKDRSEWRGSI